MISKIFNSILAVVFLSLVLTFAYKELMRPKTVSTMFEPADSNEKKASYSKAEIEAIVRDYILNNPKDLILSLEKFQKEKKHDVSNKQSEFIKSNLDRLRTIGEPPTMGNKEGSMKIIAFFDYHCSYCRKSYKIDKQLLSQDPNVQIILRPVPILGEGSLNTVKVALAVHKIAPDIFPKFHEDIMQLDKIDEASIKDALSKYELDRSLLDNEINSYNMTQTISQNLNFAASLGVTGTPSYVISDQFIKGFLDLDQLKQIILHIRSKD